MSTYYKLYENKGKMILTVEPEVNKIERAFRVERRPLEVMGRLLFGENVLGDLEELDAEKAYETLRFKVAEISVKQNGVMLFINSAALGPVTKNLLGMEDMEIDVQGMDDCL